MWSIITCSICNHVMTCTFCPIVIIIRIWTKYTWNYFLIPRLYHLITNQYQGWQIMLTIAGFLHVYYISWQILLLVADTLTGAWGMCHCLRPYLYLSGTLDTKTSTRLLIAKMRVWLILRVRDVTWLKFVANETPLRFEAEAMVYSLRFWRSFS